MPIRSELKDCVAWLTLSRPQALNALNGELLREINGFLDELEKDYSVRALVISGDGEKAFVAGADIKEIETLSAEAAAKFSRYGQEVFRRLERLKIPVIALVRGFALGGGLELALACDFIMAAEGSKFGLPEVSLGLIPGFGGTQRLARAVGLSRAREMIYTGRMLQAEEALSWGLINRICPMSEIHNQVQETLRLILSRGPRAVAAAKDAVNRGFDLDLDSGLEIEQDEFSNLFLSDEPREGIKAFIEKRAPVFKG